MNHRETAPNPHGAVCRASDRLIGKAHNVDRSLEELPALEKAYSELSQRMAEYIVHLEPEKYGPESARLRLSQLALRAETAEPDLSPVFGQDIVDVFDGVPVLAMEKPDDKAEYQTRIPDKLMVRAYIPSTENPDVHLQHSTGTLPMITEDFAADRTPETLLHKLGFDRLHLPLSIDRQLKRETPPETLGHQTVNITDIQTKGISRKKYPNSALPTGYKWYDKTKTTDELGNEVEIGFLDDEKAD